MNRKLIALDLDGTVLYHGKTRSKIHPRTIEACAQLRRNGHEIALATGRGWLLSQNVVSQLGISTGAFFNGNQMVVHGRHTFLTPLFPPEISIVRNAVVEGEKEVFAFSVDEIFANLEGGRPLQVGEREYRDMREFLFDYVRPAPPEPPSYLPRTKRFEEAPDELFFLLVRIKAEERSKLESRCPHLSFVPWVDGVHEIRNRSISKLSAIETIAATLEIPMHDTVSFGDSFNDVEMISGCGVGIAMGNANQALKDAADHVTEDANQGGIYHGCQMLGLI